MTRLVRWFSSFSRGVATGMMLSAPVYAAIVHHEDPLLAASILLVEGLLLHVLANGLWGITVRHIHGVAAGLSTSENKAFVLYILMSIGEVVTLVLAGVLFNGRVS